MDSFDVIVVGSGPGATFAAWGARGRRILMLDVGFDPPACDLSGNPCELRAGGGDLFSSMIGEEFEGLHNVFHPPVNLKLKAPYLSYIVRDWQRLTPIVSGNFAGAISLARGGLANAWGAGVYRFTDRDLTGAPFTATDLRPFYDELTSHIGVSGLNDDLEPYFERDAALQPPLRLSAFFEEMLRRYQRHKLPFRHEGVTLGRSRLAVLTKPHNGRAAYAYENLEFFKPHDPAIYNPAFTVDEMIRGGVVDYRPGRLVLRYRKLPDGIEVCARNLATGETETFVGRALCLGAGALNSARIVLESHSDYATELPLLDNPMSCIPLFRLQHIGRALEPRDTSLASLNLTMDDPAWPSPLQASLYGTTGPLRSDILFTLPFPFRTSLAVTKYLAPAMGLLMLFYPGQPGSYVRLRPGGELEVSFAPGPPFAVEPRLIRLFRRLGYLTAETLVQRPGMGAGLHYAGTLGMKANPGCYETDRNGRLTGTGRVYVVDGGAIPVLPAKNLTFTIMANALRVGRQLARDLA